ncbi:MAG TPA: helix-turn-helix domain-containing protein [Rhizomicrobium sp.]|jgi:DNA-binding transcriptional ArsR family regulator|nr:helix-turn-helix domain-containing protein [Rhizomicrobium sp.]
MKTGPDISRVASLIGDPARANMMLALMSGGSLSAADLAREAGVTPSTATGHLSKLVEAGLLSVRKQGRNRYFTVAELDVAHAVEALIAVAARAGHLRTRPGPRDEAMRHARSCYDHLAGRLAVNLFGHWLAAGLLAWRKGAIHLTRKGRDFLRGRGVALDVLEGQKRPLCRACMDWSERRHHLAGLLGAEILALAVAKGWAVRESRLRTVSFSRRGEENFVRWYSQAPVA